MKFRNLDKVKFLIREAVDLDISYAYDDLVFPEHAAFLIQYNDDNEDNFNCYFHEDCIEAEKRKIFENLTGVFQLNKCTINEKGSFKLEQKGEEIAIHFN